MRLKTPALFNRFVILILSIISISTMAVTNVGQERSFTLSDLSWMAGRWQTAAGGRVRIEEHWMSPAGSSMLGMSRTVAGDKTVEFEYIRLEQRSDGVYYVAHPKARCPGTDFKLTGLTGVQAVFENPTHDFPKRVIYQKGSDGSLTASIDGGAGTKSIKFAYLPMGE